METVRIHLVRPQEQASFHWFCDSVTKDNYSDASLKAIITFLNCTAPQVSVKLENLEPVKMEDETFSHHFFDVYMHRNTRDYYVVIK